MNEGNPGEIDFGSSQCEVRVSEGSSYRGSTLPANISRKRFYLNGELRLYFSLMDRGLKGHFMTLLS